MTRKNNATDFVDISYIIGRQMFLGNGADQLKTYRQSQKRLKDMLKRKVITREQRDDFARALQNSQTPENIYDVHRNIWSLYALSLKNKE